MRLVTASILVVAITFSSAAAYTTTPQEVPTAVSPTREDVSVPEIAKLVTVRIISETGAGSGVIIARSGQTYTVLTNSHVVAESRNNRYTVLTADGLTHQATWQRETQFGELDLALVQFTSAKSYRVAAIGNSEALSVGESVYAALPDSPIGTFITTAML